MSIGKWVVTLWVIFNLLCIPIIADEKEKTQLLKNDIPQKTDGWAKLSKIKLNLPEKTNTPEFDFKVLFAIVPFSLFFFSINTKKSQITIFFILGLVILVVFGFALYVGSKSNKIDDGEIDKIVEELFKTTAVNEYVTSCLDKSAGDALRLVGEQGGVIYYPQAKDTKYPDLAKPDWDYSNLTELYLALPFNYTNYTSYVAYGIRRPDIPIPQYPYSGNLSLNPNVYSPFANPLYNLNLGPLCITNGTNADALATILNVSHSNAAEFNNTCELSYGPNSIQYYVEKFIINKTNECVNLTILEGILGYDLLEENITSQFLIGENDTNFIIRYPIRIHTRGYSTTRFLDFGTVKNIRIKLIYFTAKKIIKRESNDIFFNIETDPYLSTCTDDLGNFIKCLPDGFNLTLYKKPCMDLGICNKGNFSDIVRIEDNESMLDGKPYAFQFAIQNRNPALENIDIHDNPEWDYISMEGENITISPRGYDPDEDYHNPMDANNHSFMENYYYYYNWSEDCSSWFNATGCGSDCLNHTWERTILNCTTRPEKWSKSSDYIASKRNATILITDEDTGAHLTRVKVCDDEEMCDYQDVKILIYDKPKAVADGYNNYYNDYRSVYASIEDPYTLDATHSIIVLGNISTYEWKGIEPDVGIIGNTSNMTIPYETFNILNIKEKYFYSSQPHKIRLTIQAEAPSLLPMRTSSTTLPVEVEQCIPYRSTSASYPYNDLTSDAYTPDNVGDFMGNHTCCLDDSTDWKYATSNIECYSSNLYGANSSFTNFSDSKYLPKSVSIYYPDLDPSSPKDPHDMQNDIFLQTFSRNCSGDRGNICNGTQSETRKVVKECSDASFGTGTRCSGPPTVLSTSNPDCQNYTGETFESTFLGDSKACNETDACVGNILVYNWTCDGNGGCTKSLSEKNCTEDNGCYQNNIYYGTGHNCPAGNQCAYQSYNCNNADCQINYGSDSDKDGWSDKCDFESNSACSRKSKGDNNASDLCKPNDNETDCSETSGTWNTTMFYESSTSKNCCGGIKGTSEFYANSADTGILNSINACCTTLSACAYYDGMTPKCLNNGSTWDGHVCTTGKWT